MSIAINEIECPFCERLLQPRDFEGHNCFGEQEEPSYFDLGGG